MSQRTVATVRDARRINPPKRCELYRHVLFGTDQRVPLLFAVVIVLTVATVVPTSYAEKNTDFYGDVRRLLEASGPSTPGLPASDESAFQRRVLLGAARNAAAAGDRGLARTRYETLLGGGEDLATRYEFVGLLMCWGSWSEAEGHLRSMVEAAPAEASYQETLADVLIQLQQLPEATALLQSLADRQTLSAAMAIRLGRVLAWQRDYRRAEEVISVMLDRGEPLELTERLGLAEYYVESARPRQALATLEGFPSEVANDTAFQESLLATQTRAEADLGDAARATETVNRLIALPPRDPRKRIDLADALYRSGHDRLASTVYQQLLESGQPDAKLVAKAVTAQVRLLDLPAARATLDRHASAPVSPEVAAAEANYLVVAGRHAEAARRYERLIAADPESVDLCNGYGHLWFSVGDFLRAEAEYRKSLALEPGSTKSTIFLARALVNSRQHEQAICVLRDAVIDASSREILRLPLIETLGEAGRYTEAAALCVSALGASKDEAERDQLRTELGFARLHQGDLLGACESYEAVLAGRDPFDPKATYGLYRSLRQAGQATVAQALLSRFEEGVGHDLPRRMRLADLATGDCDGTLAERLLAPLHAASPENGFVLIRLGESASLVDRRTGGRRDETYLRRLLEMEPDNTRARLGLARSLARTQQIDCSRYEYATLLAALPSHRLAAGERSRVTYGGHGVDAGVVEFTRAQVRTANAPSKRTDPLADLEQDLLSLESDAKWLKPTQPRRAIGYYRPLLELDRINEEAHFDLAQVYGSLDHTGAAANRFCRLLEVNPCHTEARIALTRAKLERSPQWWSDYTFDELTGRDGLTEITRQRVSTFARGPLGDENEFYYAGYAHEWLEGAGDNCVEADVALLGARRRAGDYTTLFADLEVADYTSGFATRPQFHAGIRHRDPNDVVWTVAGLLENLDSNRESIAQDIYRTGVEATASTAINWRWNLTAGYRGADYSDDNRSHEASLLSEYLLCYGEGRRQWRALVDLYAFDFDDPTRRGPGPDGVVGAVHPYFAPSGFTFATAGLEYKHWLSRHNFKYANHWWWSAYGGARLDSDGVGYGLGRLRSHRDHRNWLTTGVDASVVRSSVYDATSLRAFLIVRYR